MKKVKEIVTIRRVVLFSIILAITLWIVLSGKDDISYIEINAHSIESGQFLTDTYNAVSQDWDYEKVSGVDLVYTASDIVNNPSSGASYGYFSQVIHLVEGNNISFTVTVANEGLYKISIDQLDISSNILPNEISVLINGENQYEETRSIELPTYWILESDEFTIDRYGNEILPNSVKSQEFTTSELYDSTGLNQEALLFHLQEGENVINITLDSGEVLFGDIHILSYEETISYDEYLLLHTGSMIDSVVVVGAENIASKTSASIRLDSERDPAATAYDTKYLMLNSLDGYSFRNGNDAIYYEVNVSEAGFYNLGFKYRQDYLMQMPVFREITIDGVVPFSELNMYPFQYTDKYQNLTLNNGKEDFKFYLEEGTHTIGIRVVLEPYRNAYENIVGVMNDITDLSLEIKRLTGNTVDRYRTWDIEDYIPNIESRMQYWVSVLEEVERELSKYSHEDKPGELTNIQTAIDQLNELLDNVNEIPNKMLLLADGSSSASQLLGSTIQAMLQNGLDFEKIMVGNSDDFPESNANFFVRSWEGIKRFFLSFSSSAYQVGSVPEDTLEVWVNHPRQYIEIMQLLIDNDFTKETGIKVELSIMPDENKLILANSAGIAPDIALGVNHWIPYEFAIRGASLDLRSFDGYEEMVSHFAPGVMIPYVFEDGVFGIPETQNFWVTFYRSDILDALNIPIPQTWEEVIEILPELQRFGMNYYEPMAMFKGFKPFVSTIPFIYQFGGQLYSEDGMSTLINSEEMLDGMKLMTDLFTVYNVPVEIPNFYAHFRYGTLPIGISDLNTYLQLTIAAPEIAGQWDIALHPGVTQEDGSISRWAASGAQSSMILSASNMPNESFDFLEWWMSTEVQTDFALRLQTTYGTEYLWNTANLDAFANLPLPSAHKDIILEQWEYAMEASRIPGAYMVEREISNAWNSIVFDDTNPRITMDEAVKTANREILYKMEEFNYVMNGVIVKPYNVPTIDNIEYWLKERD